MVYVNFIGIFFLAWIINCYGRPEQKPAEKYPLELHQLFRDRVSKGRSSRTEGVWSSWGPWSTCSRTCGGGVSMQTRHCISRPVTDIRKSRRRRRKHLETNEVTNQCVGLYKRFHLCNPQECPKGRDFRAEQCASFNARPFRGRVYFWEPFLKAGDECALNCRAVGMGFYATLNQTAKDGTPCFHPMTALLQMAPPGTRGVCVQGLCKSVSADGIIGAITPLSRAGPGGTSPAGQGPQELCSACATGCRTISGLFTRPQLPPGYTLVTTVPKGACRLVVAQLKNTNNFIALRLPNGTYFLNGDPLSLGHNSSPTSAGTRFVYRRQDSTLPESVTAAGPLAQPVEIMMWAQQPNPGLKYEFMLPVEQVEHMAPPLLDARREVEPRRLDKPLTTLSQGDDARPLRRRRRKFVWKIHGMTPCTKTCGGGIQYPVVVCVREHNLATVLERRCAGLEKPRNQSQRCNTQACPAHWSGAWSACSTTCGPGQQTRVLECMQEISPTLTMRVKDGACLEPRPPTTRRCDLGSCETRDNELEQELPTLAQWHTEPWGACSVTCGSGQRSRLVSCPGRCHPESRPAHVEPCSTPACAAPPSTHHHLHQHQQTSPAPTSAWLVSDWSEQCSQGCGTGAQTRWVVCPTGECDQNNKPESSRGCSSEKQCGGKWFAGPWGECEEACGEQGKQTREVVCIVHVRGQARIVSDMTCPTSDKPVTEMRCDGACPARWFTGEWGPCEGHCPNGLQRREVRCLEYDGRYATACSQDMPALKRSCHCSQGLSTKTDYTSRESSQAQDEPSPDHRGCTDQFTNCALVVQARLCQYPYYKTSCCLSCKRAQQDTKE